MSRLNANEPVCTARNDAVELLIEPRRKDLGGFSVSRVLPAAERRAVGPFVFFDEMGPAEFPPGQGINVRPHPHIGLATVTYLFEGEILHRDSLGYVQPIQPGAVNLMTAGRGIVHSERTAPEQLAAGQRLHGIQVWMALPEAHQETEPAFIHHPATDLPLVNHPGTQIRVILGELDGVRSPVNVHARTLYLDVTLGAGSDWRPPSEEEERAVYLVDGALRLNGCELQRGTMAILRPGATTLHATASTRLLVIGGAPQGPRQLWWNFVHSDPERIEQAKSDWSEGRFGTVPGDEEFIPLPEH